MARFGFFERQMAVYGACHRDRRNRLTHVFGIPAIIFSILVASSLWRWPAGGGEVSSALALALAAAVLWLVLDLTVGGALLLLLLPVYVAAEQVALRAPAAVAWTVFTVAFVGGWALQLLGHGFEGRRPAFLDNLFQILIAPMYMTAELLFRLGLRRALAARITACMEAEQARRRAGRD